MFPKLTERSRLFVVAILLTFIAIIHIGRSLLLTVFTRTPIKTGVFNSYRNARAMILDRNFHPVAVSVRVYDAWFNPEMVNLKKEQLDRLAEIVNQRPEIIEENISRRRKKRFVYLARNLTPQVALKIKDLNLSGFFLQPNFHRFYPLGSVAAQLLGKTDIDDNGIEGLEKQYDSHLRVSPLWLTIDDRLEYLAYQTIEKFVRKFKAEKGTAVIIQPKTGEVLALVNYPSFDPNQHFTPKEIPLLRNYAAVDLFEPGSTMKSFSAAYALSTGKYRSKSLIDTNPGVLRIGKDSIHDDKGINRGILTFEEVLKKSSNIGISKIILSLNGDDFLNFLLKFGFGKITSSNCPGEEQGGITTNPDDRFGIATLSFGYGIQVTLLQLMQAYQIIANHGLKCSLSLLSSQKPECWSVIMRETADSVLKMLKRVTEPAGTGYRAAIKDYSVAGKTGTARIAEHHGYKTGHIASFIGFAPATDPKLLIGVVLIRPKLAYYSSMVAAPAFQEIMNQSLKIMHIMPDKI